MNLWAAFLSVLKGTPGKSISISVPVGSGYTRVRDVIALIDAICDAYDRNDYRPTPDGSTHCNQAVSGIAEAMGCKDFVDKTADQIFGFCSSSKDWSPVPMEKAQELANQGSLLIAALDAKTLSEHGNPTTHGHVVVIRPGHPCQSGKWGATPRCLNIGKNDFIARAQTGPLTMMPVGLNDAFIPVPRIWAWRLSL